MRKNIAAGNWKMNLTIHEARALTTAISTSSIPSKVQVILACPDPYLYLLNSLTIKKKSIHIAAQNVHQKEKGAYTGETSTKMLQSIGVNHVILGHSERREYNKETNALLKQKINHALAHGFKVIFCCGEPLKIRKSKKQEAYVRKQLVESLFHLSGSDFDNIILAYEPIWAIGTGMTASPAQAQSMHKFIRAEIAKKYNKTVADNISILYGGSVKPTNAKDIFSKPDVDGGLVGGASLKADSFKSIINAF